MSGRPSPFTSPAAALKPIAETATPASCETSRKESLPSGTSRFSSRTCSPTVARKTSVSPSLS